MGIQEVSPQNLFGGILKNRKEQLKILEGNQQILSQKKCIGFYFFDISLEDHDDGLKRIEQTTFFAPFSESTAPPLPELVPSDSRRADQDQGTLLVWLQSESQRSVEKCWVKRGYSCCHLVWDDIYAD